MPPAAETGEQPQAVKMKVKAGTNNNNSSSISCVGAAEPENLQCPRCDSTNTKFCYYNNYNLSQPRYFCKSCRRYWTRGGSLRNIPVGGGSRKKHQNSSLLTSTCSSFSSSKRPRKRDSVPILNQPNNPVDVEVDVTSSVSTLPASVCASAPPVLFGNNISSNSPMRCDMNLNEAATNSLGGPPEVSFTSLLGCGGAGSSSRGQPPQGLMGGGGSSGFLGLSSWGLGFSSVSELDGMGFGGFGKGPDWADVVVEQGVGVGVGVGVGPGAGAGAGGSSGGSSSGCNTWQLGAGEDGDGLTDGGDCFAWPDLAISTPRAALD